MYKIWDIFLKCYFIYFGYNTAYITDYEELLFSLDKTVTWLNYQTIKYVLSKYLTIGHALSNDWTIGQTLSYHWAAEHTILIFFHQS